MKYQNAESFQSITKLWIEVKIKEKKEDSDQSRPNATLIYQHTRNPVQTQYPNLNKMITNTKSTHQQLKSKAV